MGLDIYVGPLCRYYTEDWKTVVQKWGESQGVPITVIRPLQTVTTGIWGKVLSLLGRPRHDVDPVDRIRAWRDGLAAGRSASTAGWDWPEGLDIAYETDKPDFDG